MPSRFHNQDRDSHLRTCTARTGPRDCALLAPVVLSSRGARHKTLREAGADPCVPRTEDYTRPTIAGHSTIITIRCGCLAARRCRVRDGRFAYSKAAPLKVPRIKHDSMDCPTPVLEACKEAWRTFARAEGRRVGHWGGWAGKGPLLWSELSRFVPQLEKTRL